MARKNKLEELSSEELEDILDKETSSISAPSDESSKKDSKETVDIPTPRKKSKKFQEIDNPYEKFKNYKDPVTKRYRKKMFVNLFLSISLVVVSIVTVIAFIGSKVGNLTVNLNPHQDYLTMSDDVLFKEASSRLKADSVETTYPITANDLPDNSVLDSNETGGSKNDNNVGQYHGGYMAFTYFIRSESFNVVHYSFAITLVRNYKGQTSEKTYPLDEVIRVRLFKNEVVYTDNQRTATNPADQTHDQITYAKERIADDNGKFPTVNGNENEKRECVGQSTPVLDGDGNVLSYTCVGEKENGNDVLADTFLHGSDSPKPPYDIVKRDDVTIDPGATTRYTIVVWIEGEDLETTGEVPKGAGIELSVNMEIIDKDDLKDAKKETLNYNKRKIFNYKYEDLDYINKLFKKEENSNEEF